MRYDPELPVSRQKQENECEHDFLHFGSGDFYVFCYECGHRWVTIGYTPDGDAINPLQANLFTGTRTDYAGVS